jgi:hypothetical protein
LTSFWSDAAAWVQAIGTIAAVAGAAWVAARESRVARRREERDRLEAIERETHALVAAKTAALNLAILATTQIHELLVLLRDERRRGRVVRVSPSRTLATDERLLTAFPIQSLNDAESMVAFSYFPGALAMAAEVYANLEAAVRASDGDKQGAIFTEYANQMARLDETARARLADFKRALQLPEVVEAALTPPAPARLTRSAKDDALRTGATGHERASA